MINRMQEAIVLGLIAMAAGFTLASTSFAQSPSRPRYYYDNTPGGYQAPQAPTYYQPYQGSSIYQDNSGNVYQPTQGGTTYINNPQTGQNVTCVRTGNVVRCY